MDTKKVLRVLLSVIRVVSSVLMISGLVLIFCATGDDLSTQEVLIYGITGVICVLQYTVLHDRLETWITQTVYRRATRRRTHARIQKELKERNSEKLDASWMKL